MRSSVPGTFHAQALCPPPPRPASPACGGGRSMSQNSPMHAHGQRCNGYEKEKSHRPAPREPEGWRFGGDSKRKGILTSSCLCMSCSPLPHEPSKAGQPKHECIEGHTNTKQVKEAPLNHNPLSLSASLPPSLNGHRWNTCPGRGERTTRRRQACACVRSARVTRSSYFNVRWTRACRIIRLRNPLVPRTAPAVVANEVDSCTLSVGRADRHEAPPLRKSSSRVAHVRAKGWR